MIRVLLIGNGQNFHVGAHFRRALEELGLCFAFIDESIYLKHTYLHKIYYRLLKRPLNYEGYNHDIIKRARRFQPDIIMIIKGVFISAKTLLRITEDKCSLLVNFATDDPKNTIISNTDIIACIPYYDMYVCTKRAIMPDISRMGCPMVIFVPFGFDPISHFHDPPQTNKEIMNYCCDVCFIGGADKDRIPIIDRISRIEDVKLHLFGGYWKRNNNLRKHYKGFATGRNYRLAIGGAKINIGLVRRANRDGHAMRSFEIPACGGFMLAERTAEHLEFFTEGKEAEFFGSDEEMLDKIRYYLKHENERERIAKAGHLKVINGNHTYRDRLLDILHSTELL